MNSILKSKIDLLFGLGWLVSFMGGCTAKLLYEINNEPGWLNSIVVGAFVGLGVCCASLAVISSVYIRSQKINTLDKKIWAALSILIGIPMFFIGLFVLFRVLQNILDLL